MVGKPRSWTNYDITETSLISWKLKQKVKETPKAMWLLRTKIKAQTCFLWSYILWPFIISVSALALNTTWFITLWSINFLWARAESAKTAEMQPPTNLLNMFIFLKIISSGNLCYKTNPVGQISPTMNWKVFPSNSESSSWNAEVLHCLWSRLTQIGLRISSLR